MLRYVFEHCGNRTIDWQLAVPFLYPHLFENGRGEGFRAEFVCLELGLCGDKFLFGFRLYDLKLVFHPHRFLYSLILGVHALDYDVRVFQPGCELLQLEILLFKRLRQVLLYGFLHQSAVGHYLVSGVLVELYPESVFHVVVKCALNHVFQLLAVFLEHHRRLAVDYLKGDCRVDGELRAVLGVDCKRLVVDCLYERGVFVNFFRKRVVLYAA